MLHAALASLLLQGSPPTTTAPTDPDRLRAAVEVLLESQETYVPDPPVGRLAPERLEGWRIEERARLDVARADAEAPAEWPYEGVYRVAPDGRIPTGYRVGGTAIACLALLGAPPGGAEHEARLRAALGRGIDFVLAQLGSARDLRVGAKSGYDVRGWGFTYALALAVRGHDHERVGEGRRAALGAAVPGLLERLAANRGPEGGWNYAGRGVSPFQTGATLLELFDARAAGFEVDAELVEGALDALEGGRTETAAFVYSGRASEPVAGPGSAARSSVAELALFLGGRTPPGGLERAVGLFFDGWEELRVRAGEQGTHEGPYGIAPYYFLFGHAYAGEAIEALPEGPRERRRAELLEALERTRDARGAWNDRIFPRSEAYGTAMALLAIGAAERGPRAAWEAPQK